MTKLIIAKRYMQLITYGEEGVRKKLKIKLLTKCSGYHENSNY